MTPEELSSMGTQMSTLYASKSEKNRDRSSETPVVKCTFSTGRLAHFMHPLPASASNFLHNDLPSVDHQWCTMPLSCARGHWWPLEMDKRTYNTAVVTCPQWTVLIQHAMARIMLC